MGPDFFDTPRNGKFRETGIAEHFIADSFQPLHAGNGLQGACTGERPIAQLLDGWQIDCCEFRILKCPGADVFDPRHGNGRQLRISECLGANAFHAVRQGQGCNFAVHKGAFTDACNAIRDVHGCDVALVGKHIIPDGGDAGSPRNIYRCAVPTVPLQDAVQDDEVTVYHIDDPFFHRMVESLAVYFDDVFALALVDLGLVGDREAGAGGAGHAVDNSVGELQGFPAFPAFSLNNQLTIAQGNVPVHAGYGKRIGRGGIGCAHFPKSVCIHALTE